MERFIHHENISRKLLEEEQKEQKEEKRKIIQKLLAEEEAKKINRQSGTIIETSIGTETA